MMLPAALSVSVTVDSLSKCAVKKNRVNVGKMGSQVQTNKLLMVFESTRDVLSVMSWHPAVLCVVSADVGAAGSQRPQRCVH